MYDCPEGYKKYRPHQFIDSKWIITTNGWRYFVLSDQHEGATVRGIDGRIYYVSHSDISCVQI